jgi:adenylate kinase
MLESEYKLEHVSTGQWFRKEMEQGTVLGEHVREYIERGELVPDSLVLGLIEHWLTPELLERGFLLDGFPRTCKQAEVLDDFCARQSAPLEVVLFLTCDDAVILERITGRRTCSACARVYHVRSLPPRSSGVCPACGGKLVHRTDDTEDVMKKRLGFYREVTEPLVDYYRRHDKLVSLDCSRAAKEAFVEAVPALQS